MEYTLRIDVPVLYILEDDLTSEQRSSDLTILIPSSKSSSHQFGSPRLPQTSLIKIYVCIILKLRKMNCRISVINIICNSI